MTKADRQKYYQRTRVPRFPKAVDTAGQPVLPVTGITAGRPPKHDVDWTVVERLAAIHCTPAEIAAVLGIENVASLVTRKGFAAVYKRGWERGKMSLRRMQWKRAMDGSNSMLIFLGKQVLGQRDFWQGQLTGKDEGPLEVTVEPRGGPELQRLSVAELQQLRQLMLKASPLPQLPAGETVEAERE